MAATRYRLAHQAHEVDRIRSEVLRFPEGLGDHEAAAVTSIRVRAALHRAYEAGHRRAAELARPAIQHAVEDLERLGARNSSCSGILPELAGALEELG